MKLKAVLLAGAICLAGALTSSAQTVYSANTVGFVNKVIPTGFSMIGNPVIAADNTIAALFADADPGFRVFKFDPGAGSYTIFIKTGPTTWVGPANTATLVPGEGAFVSNPGAMKTFTFAGEVATGGASNMQIGAGFSIVSSPVAQAGLLQTDLGFPANAGDRVFLFDSDLKQYSIRINIGSSWINGEPMVDVGDAFFVNLVNPANWDRNFDPNAAP